MKSKNIKFLIAAAVSTVMGLGSTAVNAQLGNVGSAATGTGWMVYDHASNKALSSILDAIKAGNLSAANVQAAANDNATSTAINIMVQEKTMDIRADEGWDDVCAVLAAGSGANTAARNPPPSAADKLGSGSVINDPIKAPRTVIGGSDPAKNPMNRTINASMGKTEALEESMATRAANAGACSVFVSKRSNDLRSRACSAMGRDAPDESPMQMDSADVMADTILYGPQKIRKDGFIKRYTVSGENESEDLFATAAFQRNIQTPFEFTALNPGAARSQAGQNFIANKTVYDARMSLANAGVRDLLLNRTANPQTASAVTQMMATGFSSQDVIDYLARNGLKGWEKTGISNDEFLHLEVERRYMGRHWITGLNKDNIDKENAMQFALQNYLLLRQIHEQQTQNVLLSNISATLVRMEMMPTLRALHTQATN